MKITDALTHITKFTYDPAEGDMLTVKDSLSPPNDHRLE